MDLVQHLHSIKPPIIAAMRLSDPVPLCRDAVDLVQHLRSMAECNALLRRQPELRRGTALAAAAAYQSLFAEEDSSIPATYQVGHLGCCMLWFLFFESWVAKPRADSFLSKGVGCVSMVGTRTRWATRAVRRRRMGSGVAISATAAPVQWH